MAAMHKPFPFAAFRSTFDAMHHEWARRALECSILRQGWGPARPLASALATPLIHCHSLQPAHRRMSISVSRQYAARIGAGIIERDEAQAAVVAALTRLEERLA